MIHPDEALRIVIQAALPRPARSLPLAEAGGLRLAEPIVADRDYPPFPRAMRDGYAVVVADAGRTVEVVGEVAAGCEADGRVTEGCCYEIMTGAPCPPGTQAVVPMERVRREGRRATLPAEVASGRHVAPQASECPAGTTILTPGQTLSPLAIAVIASCGRQSVRVVPRPTLAIITTGSELVSAGDAMSPSQLRDSNGPMLSAMAVNLGLRPSPPLHADDTPAAILDTLRRSADADIIVLTGGVSVGRFDLVPAAIGEFGATILFHKVRQKPGRPMLLARKDDQLVLGLPGNPLAGHFCFHRYVTAAVRRMQGESPGPPPQRGELTAPVHNKSQRTYFVTACAESASQAGSGWHLRPLPGGGSADIFAACPANCYAQLPPSAGELRCGQEVAFTWIGKALPPT